eukprot:scaffold69908_cov39-Cyclotella_meneghiniana.AAC.1
MPTARQNAVAAAEAKKLEEEKKKAAAEEEEKKQREEAKKKRQAEKKAEEEAAKKKAEEEKAKKEAEEAEKAKAAAEAAANAMELDAEKDDLEMPTEAATKAAIDGDGAVPSKEAGGAATPAGNTNQHINDVFGGGEDEEAAPAYSSPRRKKRKTAKKDKKEKKKDKAEVDDPPSILKKGKVGELLTKKRLQLEEKLKTNVEKRKDQYEKYAHAHERVIITASLVCSQIGTQAKMNEFIMGVRVLLKNFLKVDKTVVLEPEREGVDDKLYDPTQIPLDLTEAGAWVRPSGDAGVFEMRKPRKNDKKKQQVRSRVDEVEDEDVGKVDPEVWTQICISCDVDPEELVERCSYEWSRIGGVRLQVKEIAAFATKSAATFYFLNSGANLERLKEEMKRMLVDSIKVGTEKVEDFYTRGVPEFALKLATPRIEGQKTQIFKDLTWSQQQLRKTVHIDVEAGNVPYMHEIIKIAKEFGLVAKYFGRNVKAAIVVEKSKKGKKGNGEVDMSKYDLAAVAAWSKDHINYQYNTLYDGIRGILNLDRQVEVDPMDVSEEAKRLSLRTLLYKRVKLGEFQMFLEIHQGAPMMPVDVVVGNCAEAERMMLMINKNPAAFFFYYLRDVGKCDPEFLMRLLDKSMEPTLMKEIDKCKWDVKELTLTTPQDEENAKMASIEKAAWYKDEFGESLFDMEEKEKKEFATKEQLEDLYREDKSFQTVTKKKDSPAGSTAQQGVGFDDGVSVLSEGVNSQGKEDLSKLTKEQLIEKLMSRAEIASTSGSQSGRKSSAAGGVHGKDSDGAESISSSSSHSDSSGSNSMSTSSDEGKSVESTPAHGE